MMKAVVLLCVVAVLLVVVEASHPGGVVYPFPIDSLLKCRRPDPSNPGEVIEVPTPTIPLIPGRADEVWLPEPVRFNPPRGTIDTPWLRPELDDAGFIEGVHNIYCDEDLPTINPEIAVLGSGMRPPIVDVCNESEAQLDGLGFTQAEQEVIRDFWDVVGFKDCDEAIYELTQLPDYYFPRCYVGGRCSGENCSLPRGQRCMPSTRNTVEIPAFRWDCCWDYLGGVWRWACGWYLVNIQIVTQCYCTCRPVFP